MKYIDLHCDTISAICESGRAGRARLLRRNEGHVDIERLKQGGCLAQSFALFTNIRKEPDPYTYVSGLLHVFEEEMKRNADEIKPAMTVKDLRDQEKNGGMSAVLTIGGLKREHGSFTGILRKRSPHADSDLEL